MGEEVFICAQCKAEKPRSAYPKNVWPNRHFCACRCDTCRSSTSHQDWGRMLNFGKDAEVLAVDHGTLQSGYAWIKGHHIAGYGIEPNEVLLEQCIEASKSFPGLQFVFEKIVPHNRIGYTTLDTVKWQGRFEALLPPGVAYLKRPTVKRHLCGKVFQVKDRQVRAAVIKKFSRYPDRLKGITSHVWQALALGVAYLEGARDVDSQEVA